MNVVFREFEWSCSYHMASKFVLARGSGIRLDTSHPASRYNSTWAMHSDTSLRLSYPLESSLQQPISQELNANQRTSAVLLGNNLTS